MSFSYERSDEQRDELVERVAREIQLRGLTGPGGPLPGGQPAVPPARCQRDALLRSRSCAACSVATIASASLILADDAGIELLIARLEEIDEETTWDA